MPPKKLIQAWLSALPVVILIYLLTGWSKEKSKTHADLSLDPVATKHEASTRTRDSEKNTTDHFAQAKKLLNKNLELFANKTIYCGCLVQKRNIDLKSCDYKIQSNPKRAARLEWEHVVPAEAFGQSFSEWRVGAPQCHGKKGRKCAKTNLEFSKMEGDVYNLFPEIGELNGLRSNFSMSQLNESDYDFGGCKAKIHDRKFEPMDFAKGIVARTYLHMETTHPGHGIISDKNRKLFEAWDKLYPLTELECQRWKKLEKITATKHALISRCPN